MEKNTNVNNFQLKFNKILIFGGFFTGIYFFLFLLDSWRLFKKDYFYPSEDPATYIFFTLSILLAITAYLYFYFYAGKNLSVLKRNFKLLIAFTVLFSVILGISWPMGSSDLFYYAYKARIAVVYGQNPYSVGTDFACNDPVSVFVKCNDEKMTYGPLWTLISWLPAYLTGNVILSIFFLKFMAIVFFLLSIIVVYKIFDRMNPEKKFLAASLYAWNPLVLFETANNAHNDIVMAFLLLLSLLFYFYNKKTLVLFFLLLSALIKYITLFIVPVFLVVILMDMPGWKSRAGYLLKMILSCLPLLLILLPFSPDIFYFDGISQLNRDSWLYHFSFVPSMIYLFYLLSEKLGFFNINFGTAVLYIKYISTALFAAVYFYVIVRYGVTKKKGLVQMVLIGSLLFIVFFYKVHSWYFIWLSPFILLSQKNRLYAVLTVIFAFDYFLPFFIISLLTLFIIIFFLAGGNKISNFKKYGITLNFFRLKKLMT
ncbi:hypothetical protein C4569_04165 [Candidatus Parcubacteria bacterium]|nr:MAG: hypothetical protein C4569_04165 [Candidatus Parcubacteria bacterium]